MVEFRVLHCVHCKTFQVLQVTKSKRWTCKMCNEKQSFMKEYGRGSGADCRRHVQKLNSYKGELENVAEHGQLNSAFQTENSSNRKAQTEQILNLNKGLSSKWDAFMPQDTVDNDVKEGDDFEKEHSPDDFGSNFGHAHAFAEGFGGRKRKSQENYSRSKWKKIDKFEKSRDSFFTNGTRGSHHFNHIRQNTSQDLRHTVASSQYASPSSKTDDATSRNSTASLDKSKRESSMTGHQHSELSSSKSSYLNTLQRKSHSSDRHQVELNKTDRRCLKLKSSLHQVTSNSSSVLPHVPTAENSLKLKSTAKSSSKWSSYLTIPKESEDEDDCGESSFDYISQQSYGDDQQYSDDAVSSFCPRPPLNSSPECFNDSNSNLRAESSSTCKFSAIPNVSGNLARNKKEFMGNNDEEKIAVVKSQQYVQGSFNFSIGCRGAVGLVNPLNLQAGVKQLRDESSLFQIDDLDEKFEFEL